MIDQTQDLMKKALFKVLCEQIDFAEPSKYIPLSAQVREREKQKQRVARRIFG